MNVSINEYLAITLINITFISLYTYVVKCLYLLRMLSAQSFMITHTVPVFVYLLIAS